MSSPARPLSPKRDSLFNSRSPSPNKSKSATPARNPFYQALPVKLPKLGFSMTPSRQSAVLGFSIYEDKPEEHAKYHHHLSQDAEAVNDDKENILQPKGKTLSHTPRSHRQPLANLSIAEYPGYLASDALVGHGHQRLHHVYQPKNYNNEARTVHKFNQLPSFITPPRNAMKKILYLSVDVEDDDVERRLVAKLRDMMKRKRSMSVGINRGKAHLIAKNKFKVLST